jgi:hypothetical protein
MSGSTITASYSGGVVLGSGPGTANYYASPLTITAGGTITAPSHTVGVYAPSSGGTPTLVNEGAINATYAAGVDFLNAGTVNNSGSILTTGYRAPGVYLNSGGYVSNTGLISAGYGGVYLNGAGSSLVNSGTIIGGLPYGSGVNLKDGGAVTNTGYIYGRGFPGVILGGAGGSVYNSGTIKAAASYDGVFIVSGTVTNNGTISGGAGAVNFYGSGDGPDVLVVGTAAVFSGGVTVASGATSATLELEAGNGTLAGFGTSFQGFSTINFDPGAAWTLEGRTAAFNGEVINGVDIQDTIDVTDLAPSAYTTAVQSGNLILYDDGLTLTFSNDGAYTVALTPDGSGGTDITAFCFVAGTAIATPGGEVAVEGLKIGDLVLTPDGRGVPVRWVGVSTVATRFADRLRTLPVRIQAGALGENLPVRDLLVSPDHAMFLGGVLVQAGALVNGVSITRAADMPEIFTYYHVETADHSLILAEGAATETFVDNVARMAFDNWAEHEALYGDAPAMAELAYPRAKSARQVPMALRRELAARASEGFAQAA